MGGHEQGLDLSLEGEVGSRAWGHLPGSGDDVVKEPGWISDLV